MSKWSTTDNCPMIGTTGQDYERMRQTIKTLKKQNAVLHILAELVIDVLGDSEYEPYAMLVTLARMALKER